MDVTVDAGAGDAVPETSPPLPPASEPDRLEQADTLALLSLDRQVHALRLEASRQMDAANAAWRDAVAAAAASYELARDHGPTLSALGHALLATALRTGSADTPLAVQPPVQALMRAVRAHLKRIAIQGDTDVSFIVRDLMGLAAAASAWGDAGSAFDCLTWALELVPPGDSPSRREVVLAMGTCRSISMPYVAVAVRVHSRACTCRVSWHLSHGIPFCAVVIMSYGAIGG